jgi:dethiobiotin synthetase
MLDGTLTELHSIRTQIASSKPVRARLPQRNDVLTCMDTAGFVVQREERQTLRADYPSARHFLSAIHNVGVTGGQFSTSDQPLNRRELRELIERYDSTYSNRRGGVFAMYEILYVDGKCAAPEAPATSRRDEPAASIDSISGAQDTPRGLFITGTDTSVGKTMTSAAILSVLRANNVDAIPMKPVHSGCSRSGSELVADDLEFCLTAAKITFKGDRPSGLCPYRYERACSPHLAAAQSGSDISLNHILESFSSLAAEHECIVVEGAGGPLVPIGPTGTMLDLMTALALPVILVARPGLGTINHTLLALRELRRAGLDIAGVVFCETTPIQKGDIEEDNAVTIARLGSVTILGYLPFLPEPLLSLERFESWAREHIGNALVKTCLQKESHLD